MHILKHPSGYHAVTDDHHTWILVRNGVKLDTLVGTQTEIEERILALAKQIDRDNRRRSRR